MLKKCSVCGKQFKTHKSDYKRRKTCSHRCNAIHLFKNKPKSEWHKRKIGLAHLGKKRPPFSKEWIENISKAHKGIKRTPEWKRKIGLAQKGEKGNNWKGGIRKESGGYILIYSPNHPYAKRGCVRRSHLIMEKIIGRFIISPEEVHHKGIKYPISSIKNKQDDRPKNLQLFANHSTHMKFCNPHHTQKQVK